MSEQKTIRSPLPGTFYRRPSPEAEPFVSDGDRVEPGDVIGLVEVMKTFHEVKSSQGGVVERFLVENEDPVDAGQEIAELRDG
jgi:biotin carboxyl carrier protein